MIEHLRTPHEVFTARAGMVSADPFVAGKVHSALDGRLQGRPVVPGVTGEAGIGQDLLLGIVDLEGEGKSNRFPVDIDVREEEASAQ